MRQTDQIPSFYGADASYAFAQMSQMTLVCDSDFRHSVPIDEGQFPSCLCQGFSSETQRISCLAFISKSNCAFVIQKCFKEKQKGAGERGGEGHLLLQFFAMGTLGLRRQYKPQRLS